MKFKIFTIAVLASTLFLGSCTNDTNEEKSSGAYDNGFFIINEGGFGKANAEISFISNDLVTQQNSLYSAINPGKLLGDTAQDFNANGEFGYIVMNGSNTIQVVNRYSFKS